MLIILHIEYGTTYSVAHFPAREMSFWMVSITFFLICSIKSLFPNPVTLVLVYQLQINITVSNGLIFSVHLRTNYLKVPIKLKKCAI